MSDLINSSELVWCLTFDDVIGDIKESYGIELSKDDVLEYKDYFNWGLEQSRDIVYEEIFEGIKNR